MNRAYVKINQLYTDVANTFRRYQKFSKQLR